jgi:hypothetical protein
MQASWIAKLASSKILSVLGIALAAAGTTCLSLHATIERTFGNGGVTFCSIVAIIGAFGAAFGQGLGSRRPGMVDAGLARPLGIGGRTYTTGERSADSVKVGVAAAPLPVQEPPKE